MRSQGPRLAWVKEDRLGDGAGSEGLNDRGEWVRGHAIGKLCVCTCACVCAHACPGRLWREAEKGRL